MKGPYKGYDIGYIYLADLELGQLPEKIEVDGDTLLIKSEFHISLVCLKRLAPMIDEQNSQKITAEIIEAFENFTRKHPLTNYELLKDEMRLVKRDAQKTVIVMVKVPGLDMFFDKLRQKYKVDLPTQPTHITLYTLPPDTIGIGIVSDEMLQKQSVPIDLPELEKLL
jgi:hypothetical protein